MTVPFGNWIARYGAGVAARCRFRNEMLLKGILCAAVRRAR